MREDRLVRDGTATSTRALDIADDTHYRGCTVRYREQGLYDGAPSRWRVHATGEFAED